MTLRAAIEQGTKILGEAAVSAPRSDQRTGGVPTQSIKFYGRTFRLIPRPHVVSTALELLVGQASTPARDVHVPQKPDLEVRRRSGDLPHLDIGAKASRLSGGGAP